MLQLVCVSAPTRTMCAEAGVAFAKKTPASVFVALRRDKFADVFLFYKFFQLTSHGVINTRMSGVSHNFVM